MQQKLKPTKYNVFKDKPITVCDSSPTYFAPWSIIKGLQVNKRKRARRRSTARTNNTFNAYTNLKMQTNEKQTNS
jgi:hypothetical protein